MKIIKYCIALATAMFIVSMVLFMLKALVKVVAFLAILVIVAILVLAVFYVLDALITGADEWSEW